MIEDGAYQNASEVIRAGLRLLRAQEDERQAKLAAIKAAPPAEEDAASLLTRSRAPR
jgi:putative addiction module CopG family antidote